jgi:hypothetical protein
MGDAGGALAAADPQADAANGQKSEKTATQGTTLGEKWRSPGRLQRRCLPAALMGGREAAR